MGYSSQNLASMLIYVMVKHPFLLQLSHSVAENLNKLIMVFGTEKSASVNTYQIFLSNSSFQYATVSSWFWKEKLLQCLRNASQRASNLCTLFTGEMVLA